MISRVLSLIVMLAACAEAGLAVPQDWQRADAATVRLQPGAVPGLPHPVRQELERRGCRIPQSFANTRPHNVVRGRFTSSSQLDIAVLCSRNRVSSILVFRGGSPGSVAELASQPDSTYLQVVDVGDVVGYSRALGVADAKYIREHHEQYGGPKPPRLDHDGIDDIFVEKASVVWYWSNGRWLQLQGAD